MRRSLACLLALSISTVAVGAPTAAPVRAEIDALLAKLRASGCEFGRNGSWYSGAEASAHLLRKLEYVEGKVSLQSAEEFIEVVASSSSFSGVPYQVRCGSSPPVGSRQWLTRELGAVRSSGGPSPSPR